MTVSSTRYIVDYFKGEQRESYLFLSVGLLAIFGAYYGFFYVQKPLFIGLGVPLAAMGLIQLVVGGSMALKTNKQIKALLDRREASPSTFKSDELERMEKAMQNFKIYRTIEQVLFIIGLLLVVLGLTDQISKYLTGVGIGLMIQGSILLFLDLFAELRGKEYIRRLSKE